MKKRNNKRKKLIKTKMPKTSNINIYLNATKEKTKHAKKHKTKQPIFKIIQNPPN